MADSATKRSDRARSARWRVAAEVLAEVRREPGITRASVAQHLRISSGVATEVTARLRDARLLSETEAPARGPGRPTTVLRAHPEGPLVLLVELRHEGWRCAVASLDGALTPVADGRHDVDPGGANRPEPAAVLAEIQRGVRAAAGLCGGRIRAISVSVPGVVDGTVLRQASALGWENVDLAAVVEGIAVLAEVPLLVGNDATLAGVAEVRSGAAVGSRAAVHLLVEAGPGGALVVDGRPFTGATGAASEFGHLPFGDRRTRCQCGARGCWQTVLGVRALAATLGEPETVNPREFAHHVLALAAQDSRAGERAAAVVEESAAALGAGLAGLVNALDPDVVTIAGLAIALRTAAPSAFEEAYLDGLMAFRRASPPPVLDSVHGDDGALLGAVAVGLDHITGEYALAEWAGEFAGGPSVI